MDEKIILEIGKRIEKGEKAALVTIIQIDGSSPGKMGGIMGVFEDMETIGTVGGGNLEYTVIKESIKAMKEGVSKELEFQLVEDAALHMKCGGSIKIFIKVFNRREIVVIVGGGHVGGEIYKIFEFLEMDMIMVDDREKFCNKELYPSAKDCIVGDIKDSIEKIEITDKTYVIIVTRGHKYDKDALKGVLNKGATYIGMIGSKKKVKETLEELLKEGFSKDIIENVYSPIGLDISNGSPKEIAISVASEVLKVKNGLTGLSMKEKMERKNEKN